MLLNLNLELERKLKLILDRESRSFEKFLLSQKIDIEDLEDEEELNELITEYNKEKEDKDKKIKNELAVLALLVLENVRSNFAAALKTEAENKKLELLMSKIDIKKYIKDYIDSSFELYSKTPERFLETLKKKDFDKFEDADELIDKTEITIEAYNTYHSIMQSGGLYLNFENSTLNELDIDSYIWRDMRDNLVRFSHEIRHGKRFDMQGKRIDGPHPDGEYYNPKEQPGCRCSKFIDNETIRKAVIDAKV